MDLGENSPKIEDRAYGQQGSRELDFLWELNFILDCKLIKSTRGMRMSAPSRVRKEDGVLVRSG